MKKKWIFCLVLCLCVVAGGAVWLFTGNTSLNTEGIEQITIRKLPEMNDVKRFNTPEEIQEFVDFWNEIPFRPVIRLDCSAGTYAFVDFHGEPYRYSIMVLNSHQIQIGIRYYQTDADLFELLTKFCDNI